MLKILYPAQGQLCRVGYHVTAYTLPTISVGSLLWGYKGSAPSFSVGDQAIHDPLWGAMQSLVVRTQVQAAKFLFGMPNANAEEYEEELSGPKPLNIPFNQETDRKRHGGNLAGLYTMLNAEEQRHHVVVNESEVSHLNFYGAVSHSTPSTDHQTVTYGSGTFSRWNINHPKFSDGVGHRCGVWDATLQRFTATSGRVDPVTPAYAFLDDFIQAVIDGGMGYTQVSGPSWYKFQHTLVQMSIEPMLMGTRLTYTWNVRCWTKQAYPGTSYFDVTIERALDVYLDPSGSANDPAVSGDKPIPFGIRLYSNNARISSFAYGPGCPPGKSKMADWVKGLSFGAVSYFRTAPYRTEGQYVCTAFGTGFGKTLVGSQIWHDGYKLKNYYGENEKHLVPAVFYSTGEAMRNYVEVVSANHIETLTGLDDIISMVKSLGNLIKFFRALRRMNIDDAMESGKALVKPKSLRRLMDTATGSYLAYQFGVAPMLSDGKEFVEEYDAIVNRLASESKWGSKVLFGEFRYDNLPDSPFGPISMRVHTKTCLGFEDTSLLTLIFSAAAIGVLPGLAALWECVPWSFAIDWFTNASQRLEDVDNQALLFLLEHYYSVHSIKLISQWSDDYCSSANLEVIEDPRTTYYHRWLSYILPTLRPSKYDFRAPSGNLPWKIVGCLSWQLLG